MKKLVSLLSAFALLAAAPMNSYAINDGESELYNLAKSLGCETDYLDIENFTYYYLEDVELDKAVQDDYLRKCSVLEATYSPYSFLSSALLDGSDTGISILEVLAHNGVISPEDIKPGTEKLTDIPLDKDTALIISGYQALQTFTEFGLYKTYLFTSQTYDEQIEALISSAEQCMADNKYFFISMIGDNKTNRNNVCGMGVADGKWNWNGNDYDKCILTLDANAKGFDYRYCIYINSETHSSCVPAYDLYSEKCDSLRFIAITDDTLLNYKGVINPSDSINTDVSKLTLLSPKKSNGSIMTGKVTDEDTVHFELGNSTNHEKHYIRYINTQRWIDVELYNRDYEYSYSGDFDISDNKVNIKNTGDKKMEVSVEIRMNEGTYGFSPYYAWGFNSYINDDISAEIKENGVLFSSDGTINISLTASKWLLDENGEYARTGLSMDRQSIGTYLQTNNDVLVCIDENEDFRFYIDDNCDGVFDAPVQSGDINCDGKINASDASQVLTIYSKLSTTRKSDISCPAADMNGDGQINAIDASDILAEYSKLSTT